MATSGRWSNYFGKEMLIMKIFGISLYGHEGIAYKIYSLIFVIGTIFVYSIVDGMEYFKQDFNGIADILSYQIGAVVASCKVSVLYLNRDTFVKLLLKLEEEPFLPNRKRGGDKEEELVKECVWITSVQTYVYWILTSFVVTSTIVYTFIKRVRSDDYHDWMYPYGKLTLLNTTYSPNYEITMSYQATTMVFMGTLFTSTDLLLATVLAHITYQFKMLQNNIRRLLYICYEEMIEDIGGELVLNSDISSGIDGSTIPWIYLKKNLKKLVQYHTAIIDIAAEIEKAFSFMFLIVFLATMSMVCFAVYAATAGGDPQTVIRHVIEGICVTLQVAIVCYWGQQVTDESQLVGKAITATDFVGTDVRFQKMLAFIIRRSQNPTTITAGKFSNISLTAFSWIMRTSYSSFMVLRRSRLE